MDNSPKYVFKTNEAVLMPKNTSRGMRILKITVWITLAVIIVGSLVLRENLFMEMSGSARLLYLILVIGVLFVGGQNVDVSSPIELQFYDDYLILYRPKRYYDRRTTRMEYIKFAYADITRCVYLSKSKRVHIYGDMEGKCYNYDSEGNVSETPSYDRFVTETMMFFSTRCAQDVDFKQVIESNSPIQVTVEDR